MCLERNWKGLKWLPDLQSIKASLNHPANTILWVVHPVCFDFPIKQQALHLHLHLHLRLVGLNITVTLRAFILAQDLCAVERRGGSPGEGGGAVYWHEEDFNTGARQQLRAVRERRGGGSRWAAGMHLYANCRTIYNDAFGERRLSLQ